MLGLPVLDAEKGKEIGKIKQVIIDHRKGRLDGFISGGGWLARDCYLRFDQIQEIAKNGVILKDKDAVRVGMKIPSAEARNEDLIGRRVITGSGQVLGMVEDVLFDDHTGRLAGIELSRGLVQDLVDGRVTMPIPEVYTAGRDTLVLPEDLGKMILEEMNPEMKVEELDGRKE